MDDEQYMREAIRQAKEGIRSGQTPFGACIVKDGRVVSAAHNRVWDLTDPTAHAEVVAIREACQALGTIDLSGCVLYSTCEPCPMCFSACHWAKLDRVVSGARIADAAAAGFRELGISNETMRRLGGSPLRVEGDVLREENLELFRRWAAHPGHRSY